MNHHPSSSSSSSSSPSSTSSSSNHFVAKKSSLKATMSSHGEVNRRPLGQNVVATATNNNNNNRRSAIVVRPKTTSIANNNESTKENNPSYCIPDPVQHHHNYRSLNVPCRPPCRSLRRSIHSASRRCRRPILRERQRDIPEQMSYHYPQGHDRGGRHTRTLRQQHRRMRRSNLVTAHNNNNVHDDAGYDGDNEMCKGRYDCNKGTVYDYRNAHNSHNKNSKTKDCDVSRLLVNGAIEVNQPTSLLGTPTGQVKRSSPGPLSHSSFQAKGQRLPEHREVRSILKGLRDQVDKTFANVTELNKMFDEVTELGKHPPRLDLHAVPQLPVETSPRHSPPPPNRQMYELLSLSEILSPATPDSDVTEQPQFPCQDLLPTTISIQKKHLLEASLQNASATNDENHAIDRIPLRNDNNNNLNDGTDENYAGDSMKRCSNSNSKNDENNFTANSMNRRHNTDNDSNYECDVAGICDNNNNENESTNLLTMKLNWFDGKDEEEVQRLRVDVMQLTNDLNVMADDKAASLEVRRKLKTKLCRLAELHELQGTQRIAQEAIQSGLVNESYGSCDDYGNCFQCHVPIVPHKRYYSRFCCDGKLCSSCDDDFFAQHANPLGQVYREATDESEVVVRYAINMENAAELRCPVCLSAFEDSFSVQTVIRHAIDGQTWAQHIWGETLVRGSETVTKDRIHGLSWLEKAATAGHTGAMLELQTLWEEGFLEEANLPPSDEEAEAYLLQAAKKGCSMAQCRVGFREYFNGNHNGALIWFTLSAGLGCPGAQTMMGSINANEDCGVRKSIFAAIYWYQNAAINDFQIAQSELATSLQEAEQLIFDVDRTSDLVAYCVQMCNASP